MSPGHKTHLNGCYRDITYKNKELVITAELLKADIFRPSKYVPVLPKADIRDVYGFDLQHFSLLCYIKQYRLYGMYYSF